MKQNLKEKVESPRAHTSSIANDDAAPRRVVQIVAMLNLAYFGVEFGVALAIGSVSLFADSIDFLEDAAVNGLILIALNWNPHRRSLVGMALVAIFCSLRV